MTPPFEQLSVGEGILTEEAIWERLRHSDAERRVFVVPMMSKKQVDKASVDLRLGSDFVISRRTKFEVLDPLQGDIDQKLPEKAERFSRQLRDYQERVRVPMGDCLTLHPNQFVLGATLEYVRLPRDLAGYVIGRSSWGRLGLIIATATLVQPGFAGDITLELANVGDAPLKLYPGVRIAQLTLHEGRAVPPPDETPKYFASIGPGRTNIARDRDWPAIQRLAQNRRDADERSMDEVA